MKIVIMMIVVAAVTGRWTTDLKASNLIIFPGGREGEGLSFPKADCKLNNFKIECEVKVKDLTEDMATIIKKIQGFNNV